VSVATGVMKEGIPLEHCLCKEVGMIDEKRGAHEVLQREVYNWEFSA